MQQVSGNKPRSSLVETRECYIHKGESVETVTNYMSAYLAPAHIIKSPAETLV